MTSGDPSDNRPSDDRPSGDPSGDRPSDNRPSDDRPSNDRPSGDRPSGDRPKPGRDARRLFVGIRPSVATIAELGEVCETLARRASAAAVPIRWVPAASYHVTVKFLGWTRPETVPAIVDVLRAAATLAPFSFTTARLGAFPSRDRASVVWAGAEHDAFTRLARALDAGFEPLGFARERRPFHGHVTLGRLRDPKPVSEVLLPFSEQVFSATTVHSYTLYESVTKPSGSEYKPVATIDLLGVSGAEKRQTVRLEPGQHDATSYPAARARSPLEGVDTDDGWPRGQGPSSDE